MIKQILFVNIITECPYDNQWPGLRLKAGELNQTKNKKSIKESILFGLYKLPIIVEAGADVLVYISAA